MSVVLRGAISATLVAMCGFAVVAVGGPALGQTQGGKTKPKESAAIAMDVVSNAEWTTASTAPLTAPEMDKLITAELDRVKITRAPLTTDEQFIRRVYLDVVGKLPRPVDVTSFVNDPAKDKRAKLIDRLLDSDDYARNWSRYWKNVVTTRVTDFLSLFVSNTYERWLYSEFKKNAGWGEIVREMVTAKGTARPISSWPTAAPTP